MTCPTFQIASIKDNRSYNFYSRPLSGSSGRRNLDRPRPAGVLIRAESSRDGSLDGRESGEMLVTFAYYHMFRAGWLELLSVPSKMLTPAVHGAVRRLWTLWSVSWQPALGQWTPRSLCSHGGCRHSDSKLYSVLVSFGMLLDETEAPMDFSRSSELTEFEGRPVEMDHLNARKSPADEEQKGLERGLDLSNSVLDRLSQKVMRSGSWKLHISPWQYFNWSNICIPGPPVSPIWNKGMCNLLSSSGPARPITMGTPPWWTRCPPSPPGCPGLPPSQRTPVIKL